MLKLEIKMDESKIEADRKYQAERIYQALESAFSRYSLNKIVQPDGTLCFVEMEIRKIMVHLEALLLL